MATEEAAAAGASLKVPQLDIANTVHGRATSSNGFALTLVTTMNSDEDITEAKSPSCRRRSVIDQKPTEWKLNSPHSPLYNRRKSSFFGSTGSNTPRSPLIRGLVIPAAAEAVASPQCASPLVDEERSNLRNKGFIATGNKEVDLNGRRRAKSILVSAPGPY